MKRVLFLVAHVDDAEISCGGTIARLKEEGHSISVFSLSRFYGEVNLFKEFSNSMNTLQITHYGALNFGVRDFSIRDYQAISQHIYESYQEYDEVYTHSPEDDHPDHSTVGQIAIRVLKNCSIFTFKSPFNTRNMDENMLVRIHSRHLDKKLEALACYKSQSHRAYMQKDVVLANARVRGLQAGCEFAEAFKIVKLIQ